MFRKPGAAGLRLGLFLFGISVFLVLLLAKEKNHNTVMKKKRIFDPSSLPTRGKKTGAVRIFAGKWKRTPLPVIDLDGLRPTGNRIRETVFDWLTFLLGGYSGKRALDMFAGSGALGLEFASRGVTRFRCL